MQYYRVIAPGTPNPIADYLDTQFKSASEEFDRVMIYVNQAVHAERERCLAACQLSESETNQLYSAETARYIETKIRKGQ